MTGSTNSDKERWSFFYLGKYAMRDLVQKLPSCNQTQDHTTSDDTIAAVLATLNEVIKKHPEFSRFAFFHGYLFVFLRTPLKKCTSLCLILSLPFVSLSPWTIIKHIYDFTHVYPCHVLNGYFMTFRHFSMFFFFWNGRHFFLF